VVLRFLFCKKRHVMPYVCWTGPSYPHSKQCAHAAASVENILGPDLGLQTPVSKVLRSEAEVNFDEQPKQARSKAQLK
jgi:hypothetical protein